MALLKMQLNILVFISTTFISNLVVIKLPYLKSTMLCSKLSKGIGHNYYGEPAWPNDILYIFPIVIFGISCLKLGLAIHEPYNKSEDANPFATPLEILPEWYLFTTFNFLRILSSKLIGILSMFYLPGVLLIIPFGENLNRYQNPFRRPIMVSIFLSVILYSIWLSIGPLEAIIKGLPLI
jgi:cytochrome b6-f complex subunit 4